MFKTRLDSYGNDFGFVWNFGNFLIFLEIFEDSTLHGTLGKKFFERKYPKTCSKHVWTFLGTILGFSAILKSLWFFWKFSTTRPSKEHRAKNVFGKIASKHVQHTFGHFWERFRAFLHFLKNFRFFWKFSTTQPCMEHWAKKISGKINPKYVQSTFGHFWERFRAFLQFLKSFDFFENFRRLDLPRNTGQKNFLEKIAPKHVQNTFGHSWERFWAFLEFWKVFWFFWNLSTTRPSKEHWVKKLFQKKRP